MDDPELAALLADARHNRRRPSRGWWLAAAVIGSLCAVGFVLAMWVAPAAPASTLPAAVPTTARPGGPGFTAGLVIGLGGGLLLGVAIARQLASHSSRSRP